MKDCERRLVDRSPGSGGGFFSNNSQNKDVTISWSGSCPNQVAEGFGTLKWFKDGKLNGVFTGSVVDGRPDGHGILELPGVRDCGFERAFASATPLLDGQDWPRIS
jgi:hypothetical protein